MRIFRNTNLNRTLLFILLCSHVASCSKKLQPLKSDNQAQSFNAPALNHNGNNLQTHLEEIERNLVRSISDGISSPENDFSCIPIADKLIDSAREYLGVPHCMGGKTEKCLDCSGFVMIVFEEHGISLPHNAQAQSRHGTLVKARNDLRKGDIVFFHGSYKTSNYITHSGIYIGDNQFIHTSSGKGVTITSMDDSWWKEKYAFGTRILQ